MLGVKLLRLEVFNTAPMRRLFTRSRTPTPPDPSREIPAVVALRIASLFAFLEGRFTSEHACGDASLEAVCALAHQWMIPITLEGIYRTAGPHEELDAMYALVVNDVAMSPAAMWSHDHAKLSDVDALHSRCVAELAEVAALLRNVNVSSSSCCHVMTGAIKRALRSYAPLLTFAAHDAWVEAAASGDERRLAKLAVSLPPTSAWLLSELLAHAKAVLAQTSENRMTSLSLAITLFVNVLRVEDAAGASFVGSERMTEFLSYSYLLSPPLSLSLSSLSLSLPPSLAQRSRTPPAARLCSPRSFRSQLRTRTTPLPLLCRFAPIFAPHRLLHASIAAEATAEVTQRTRTRTPLHHRAATATAAIAATRQTVIAAAAAATATAQLGSPPPPSPLRAVTAERRSRQRVATASAQAKRLPPP